ncbi:hypothetical protein ACFXGA_13560 [Actinosynnema sp. NPDC059335]|uniref:hypothetical protein n=1 Tax=Actinosynnema sp. NPDC059335 TaxID=3346804 RepID=UPI00366AC8B1
MITAGGTDVEAWVRVDDECDIVCEVDRDEVQFRFGGTRSFALELIFTERGLENLSRISADALRRLRER